MNEQTLDFINKLDSPKQDLVRQLHDVLREIEPQFHVEPLADGLGFKRGDNFSCMIDPHYPDHIKLKIWRAVNIPDPDNMLEGEGENSRYIKIYNPTDIKSAQIEDVLNQQFRLFDSGVSWQDDAAV